MLLYHLISPPCTPNCVGANRKSHSGMAFQTLPAPRGQLKGFTMIAQISKCQDIFLTKVVKRSASCQAMLIPFLEGSGEALKSCQPTPSFLSAKPVSFR